MYERLYIIPAEYAATGIFLIFLGATLTSAWLLEKTHIPPYTTGTEATWKQIFFVLLLFSLVGGMFGFIEGSGRLGWLSVALSIMLIFGFLCYGLLSNGPRRLQSTAAGLFLSAFAVEEIAARHSAGEALAAAMVAVIIFLILTVLLSPIWGWHKSN